MRKRVLLGGIFALLLSIGCDPEAAVPADAEILCSAQGQCPGGFACRPSIGRCISATIIDDPAPQAIGIDLSATVFRDTETLLLSFTADTELFENPRVRATGGAGTFDLELDLDASDLAELDFAFRHAVESTDPEGSFDLLVDLVGRNGATTVGQRVGTITIDRTPPTVLSNYVDLRLAPGPQNPLTEVETATVGSRVLLTFAVSEPLADDPVVEALPSGAGLDLLEAVGIVYTYEATIPAGVVSGEERLELQLTDLAGNQGQETLAATFVIDVDPPALPDVEASGRIVLKRVPWGASETGGLASMSLQGLPGASEPGSTLLALALARDVSGAVVPMARTELARIAVDPAGGIPLTKMIASDRPELFVQAIDPAGNLSGVARIRDVLWVATLGGKRPGDFLSNPHQAIVTGQRLDFPDLLGEEQGAAELGLPDNTPAIASSGARWIEVPLDHPSARANASISLDERQGHLLLFGGNSDPLQAGSYNLGDTWSFDGERWIKLRPSDPEQDGNPPARAGQMQAYDRRTGQTWLFGGKTQGYRSDLWTFDGRSWRKITSQPTWPTDRAEGAFAFDPRCGAALLFGGRSTSVTPLGDTWELRDGSFVEILPSGPVPAVRYGAALTYFPVTRSLLLFGGDPGSGPHLSELWSYDCETGTWSQILRSGAWPAARIDAGWFHDDSLGQMVLVGGTDSSNLALEDVWVFDGSSWSQDSDYPSAGLVARQRAAAAASPARDGWVMVGGLSESTNEALAQTLTTSTGSWQVLTIAENRPPPRSNLQSTYQSDTKQIIGYGRGPTSALSPYIYQVGQRWRSLTLTAIDPLPKELATISYNPLTTDLLVTGGHMGDGALGPTAGIWSTSGGGYLVCNPTNATCPPARLGAGSAFDPLAGETMIYGGDELLSTLGDLWSWNGSVATQLLGRGGNPGQRLKGPQLVWDEPHQMMLVHGVTGSGSSRRGYSAWIDRSGGTTSLSIVPGTSPNLLNARLAYEPTYREVVLFGGLRTDGTESNALWRLRTGGWERVAIADPLGAGVPAPRSSPGFVLDGRVGRVTLFGGDSGAVGLDDHWTLDPGVEHRPGVVTRFSTAAAGISSDGEIVSLSVQATGSGQLSAGLGSLDEHFQLAGWRDGAWRPLLAQGAPGETVVLDWGAPSDELASWMTSRSGEISLSVVSPLTGLGRSTVELDYIELTLGYRLPTLVIP